MRGTIHICLQEIIIKKYGEEIWNQCLVAAGFSKNYKFYSVDNIDEEKSISLFKKTAEVTKTNITDVFDAFGEHWACVYAPREYQIFYLGAKNTQQFLEKIDGIHQVVTKSFKDAHPPRFSMSWLNEKTLNMEYSSQRNLLDLALSITKGLAKHFKEDIIVEKVSDKQAKVFFS